MSRDAIRSILSQTYSDIEVIIVDDYSTDRSIERCRAITDNRIRIHTKTSEAKNLASSRNIGVQLAKADYVTFQDADDTSDPRRIEIQLRKALENPGRRVVGCSVKRVGEGVERSLVMPEMHHDIVKGFTRLFNRGTVVGATILAPKRVMERIPYRVHFNNTEDWDQLLRLHEDGCVEFYNCQELLYTYFVRAKMMSRRPDQLNYNIFARNCQSRRRKGLAEFDTLESFLEYLSGHACERWMWFGLRKLIELKRRVAR